MEGYGNENPGAFQPTRPLRGATTVQQYDYLKASAFQPTRPLRGATKSNKKETYQTNISTHAPLAGRDGPG